MQQELIAIFNLTLEKYGPQGWWPLLDCDGSNPTSSGEIQAYHPNDFSYPHTEAQKLEIAIGALLTQNTNWELVERALLNLRKIDALHLEGFQQISDAQLVTAIHSTGYYNQKAKKLKLFMEYYASLKGATPKRDELLSIWGIGEETADSILLYAYKIPTFVVDNYTKRIFSHLGIVKPKCKYADLKAIFQENLEPNVNIFQEYHALLVEHAKNYYYRRPHGMNCPLKNLIKEVKEQDTIITYKHFSPQQDTSTEAMA